MNDEFWILKTKAFFHDPPDKALKIQGHVERSDKLLITLLESVNYIPQELDKIIKKSDNMVSSLQRISINVKSSKGLAEPVVDFSQGYSEEFEWNNKIYKVISHKPILVHPVTGKKIIEYEHLTSQHTEFTQNMMTKTSSTLSGNKKDVEKIFILSWRFFREYMKQLMIKEHADEKRVREVINLPADTRTPDHTIWDHMDLVSAVASAMYGPTPHKNRVISLIAIKISPVQNFIKNARKMRDLWAGSHLLSMLTFIAIRKIIDVWGPDAIIYPYLRGQPFLDLYYKKKYGNTYGKFINTEELEKKAYVANMPNVVLGIIGIDNFSEVERIEDRYEDEIREEIGRFLKDILEKALEDIFNNKESVSNYESILNNYFEITVKILPIYPVDDPEKFKNYVESLPDESLRSKYSKWIDAISKLGSYGVNKLDLYPLAYELLMHLLSLKSGEKITKNRIKTDSGDKCTMCGEFVPMKEFKTIKLKGNIIRENERLCPLCFLKRYYPTYISQKGRDGIKVDKELLKMESVSEIAMKSGVFNGDGWSAWTDLFKSERVDKEIKKVLKTDFINKEIYYEENITKKGLEKLGYSGIDEETAQKLRKYIRENYPKHMDKSIYPPKYYSLLLMDGDDMGTVLNGEAMKNIEDYIHPDIIEAMDKSVKDYIKTKRLLTPTTHAAISRSLMNFSVNKVNNIVDKFRGRLIYSGGDDVLAFLPRDTGFDAAYKIREVFSKSYDEDYELLPNLNMSGGLLVVHYKYPLYAAMDMVRRLEEKAKDVEGKNSLAIGYLERSGNYYEVIVNWKIFKNELLKKLMKYTYNSKYYKESMIKLSPRFIYTLLGLLEKLEDNADENMIYDLFIYQLQQHMEVRKDSSEDISKGELIKKEFGDEKKLLELLDYIKFPENKKSTYKLKLRKLLELMKICLENEGCRGEGND